MPSKWASHGQTEFQVNLKSDPKSPLYLSMSPNRAIPANKSIHSPPLAAAQLLTTHSWAEGSSATRSERACRMAFCRMAFCRNACPFLVYLLDRRSGSLIEL